MLNESLDTAGDDISPSVEVPISCGVKTLTIWAKAVRVLTRILFFWVAQGGFCLYTHFAVCHLIAPYFAIATGIGLRDPFLVISSILTILVFYPYFELIVVAPIGIWADMGNVKLLSRLSPLHWAMKALDYAISVIGDRTCVAVTILMIATVAILALAVTVGNYFANDSYWAAFVVLLFTFPPILFALWNIFCVIFHSWIYFVSPSKMCQLNEEEESKESWPLLSMWESYARDITAGPIIFRRSSRDLMIHIVMTILFWILVGLNIFLLIRHFNWIYLLSSIVTWICYPFLIRFNVFKVFRKHNYEYHHKFRRYGFGLFGLNVVIFTYFLLALVFAIIQLPPKYLEHDFNISGQAPFVNVSFESELPTVCTTQLEGLSILQYAGIAEIGDDSVHGKDFVEKKLRLIFGDEWNQSIEINETAITDFVSYQRIHFIQRNVDLIVIAGTNTLSNGLLLYLTTKLYQIPEQIFQMIPFAQIFYEGLLKMIISALTVPVELYNPLPLISAYLDPVQDYVKRILPSVQKLLLVGAGAGGETAKILGMHLSVKAIAFNAPEVRLWFLNDFSKPSVDLAFGHNVLITNQLYAGAELGGMAQCIPFDDFPMNPASQAAVICTLGIQCQVLNDLHDFCEKSIPEDIWKKIQENSPYH
jgi:hypothetical protein